MSTNTITAPVPVTPLAFSPEDTCAMIGCSRMSLWRLEQRGLLVPVRHLRRPVYSRVAIDRYLSGALPVPNRKGVS